MTRRNSLSETRIHPVRNSETVAFITKRHRHGEVTFEISNGVYTDKDADSYGLSVVAQFIERLF